MSPASVVPPQSIQAEESALGAMLITESVVADVFDVGLEVDDFYLDRHRIIYECIGELRIAGRPIDEITVAAALTDQHREVFAKGGTKPEDYLAKLAATVAAAGNAGTYAEIVRDCALLRKKQDIGKEAANGLPVKEAIEQLRRLEDRGAGIGGKIRTVKGSEVRLRVPRFLDAAEMLPMRSITVVFGPAGLGKTVYSLGHCAAVTAGRMSGIGGPAPVLISSLEDDPEAVLAPRLAAAGADLDLVHFVSGLSLPSQVAELSKRAKALGAVFVLIDPVAAHLDPDIDSHRDASIRAALSPLAEAAQDLDLSVLVVAHPNKATSATGLNRISGSGAFGNAARSVIVFGLDPGDPDGETGNRRIIAHLKNNVGRRASSICAELELTSVDTEDGPTQVPRLKVTGFSDHSADDVLSSPTGDERTERDDAREFLREQLAGGPVRSKELKASAEQNGLNWRTVERAKRDLGLKAKQTADGWYWLPPGQHDLGDGP